MSKTDKKPKKGTLKLNRVPDQTSVVNQRRGIRRFLQKLIRPVGT